MTPTDILQPSDFEGSKILIVDDERINNVIMRRILEAEKFLVTSADSGEEALEKYRAEPPDLMLLDVMLPGRNGFETCQELHREYGAETAPIVFLTAKANSEDVVTGLSVGGVDYLQKPFRSQEVVARVRTHLQTRRLVSQLRDANAAKNRFLGMAAHDLRNPLASIRGLSEFLRESLEGKLDQDQQELFSLVEGTAQSMLELLNELLDVATIESGELQVRPQTMSLNALINSVVMLANLQAVRKRTTVDYEPIKDAPPIHAGPARIKQVLENLLSNAVKYPPPGSRIKVGLEVAADHQTVHVIDQGPGIPEDERDKLFKDFGRLSVQPTAGEKSTGLGLAICRKIIDAHAGTIGATNQPTGGCEFHFSLPTPA